MAKTKQQKQKELQSLLDALKDSKSVVFSTYHGLKVSDVTELRRLLRKAGAKYYVSKKTLMKIAFKDLGKDIDLDRFDQDLAVSFGISDEIAPAKIIADFSKKHAQVKMLGGMLEGAFLDDKQVGDLARIPSREELLAKLVGSLASPLSGFVNVLQGNTRGFINVLKALSEKKGA